MRALALLSLFLFTACAGGPVGAPSPMGPSKIEKDAIVGATRLPLSVWRSDQPPMAALLALHGFGDYGPSTYARAAEYWATRGIATYAYDQRGFGRGETRGAWPGAETLIADAKAATAAVRKAHPDIPVFLLGHSMGGGVALAAAGEGVAADGLILAAPAVWGGERLALPYRAAAWAGALILPDRRWTGEGLVRIQASDNIDMLRALGGDPIYLRNPSSREFMGLIRIMDRAAAAAPKVSAPTLTLWGAKDEVLERAPIEAAHEAIPSPKRMEIYPEGWHLLFRDLQAEIVWRDVAEWVLDQPQVRLAEIED